ncbi:hypothetical protein T02_15458 [Trichinella nativa]|uniref:Uncharacterized protein n=1 Tax=Trichinella nativa TaxID=6335 RepID=A0A0V1L990_9BILA|nr:hypothetical protein T02_15458 [Trichinella nativa]
MAAGQDNKLATTHSETMVRSVRDRRPWSKQISASVGTFGVDCKLYAQAMYSCEIKHHRVIRTG